MDISTEYNVSLLNDLKEGITSIIDLPEDYTSSLRKIFLLVQSSHYEESCKIIQDLKPYPKSILEYLEIMVVQIYLLQGKVHIAKEKLEILKEQFPQNPYIYILSGDAASFTKDWETAEKEYKKAVIVGKNTEKAYTRLAGICKLKGDNRKAIRMCQKALENEKANKDELESLIVSLEKQLEGKRSCIQKISTIFVAGETGFVEDIQVASFKGNGRLVLTGNTSLLLKESILISWNFLKVYASKYGITSFSDLDVHLHFPYLNVHKDGPSVGLPVCLALYAVLVGKSIPSIWAFTGELDLEGRVLPVGGIAQKVQAAYSQRKAAVFLPAGNWPDTYNIHERIKKRIELIKVNHVSEVLRLI